MQYVDCAAALYEACEAVGVDQIVATAMPVTWRQGVKCVQQGEPRVGYRILLHAINNTPGAAQALIAALEEKLAGHAA